MAGHVGVNEAQVLELLKVNENTADQGKLHDGNQVTNDVKQMVKVRVKSHRLSDVGIVG